MYCLLSPLLAACPAPALPSAAQHEELVTLWVADSDQVLRHPKDRGLAGALALVRPRLEELPAEVPDLQFPPQVVAWATALLGNEKSLRIGRDDSAAPLPLALQLDWSQAGPEAAAQTAAELAGFLDQMGAPVQAAGVDGWVPINAPTPLPLGFGPRGNAVSLGLGNPFAGPLEVRAPQLPEGVSPDSVARIDFSGISDLVLENMAMAEPQATELAERIIGLLALDELEVHYASGADDQHTHSVLRMPGYGAALTARGLFPAEGIATAHLRAVPVDATWANLIRIDLQGVLDLTLAAVGDFLAEEGIEDPVEMFTQLSGIHLERDVLDHLGGTLGVYASDTTGGGGLMSTVAFLEVADPEGLLPFLERMQALANGVGFAEANGYLQVRGWEQAGTRCWTLTTPGLPVPTELSMALSGDLLLFGATPSALIQAMDQAAGASSSLLDHPGFRASAPGELSNSYVVAFLDTPRMIRDGYGLLSLAASALANGTRSLRDESRDAGLILPSYHELMKGAQATVSVARLTDGDLVSHTRSDASLVVNLAGAVGYNISSPMFWASFASGFLGQLQPSPYYSLRAIDYGGDDDYDEWEQHR